MREQQIIEMNQRRAKTEMVLLRQNGRISARLEAFETLVKKRPFLFLFRPALFWALVNKNWMGILRKHDRDVSEAAQKVQEDRSKPKLTIVPANAAIKSLCLILLVLSLSSCVPPEYHKNKVKAAYDAGYQEANAECLNLQLTISEYVDSLKARLRKFNQLNEDDTLRTRGNDDSRPHDE